MNFVNKLRLYHFMFMSIIDNMRHDFFTDERMEFFAKDQVNLILVCLCDLPFH